MDDTTLQLIQNYQTPAKVIERLKNIQTVILTGITGAGKDTIIGNMLDDQRFVKVVTSTTRQPRENHGILEQEGVEYYFLTDEQAKEKIQNGDYIEVANVHGRVYGSLIEEYERIATAGKTAVTAIDYQGARDFLSFGMSRLLVLFVVPPSFDVWFERLTGRHGGSLEGERDEIINRFRSAQKELAHALTNPQFVPIMNIQSTDSAQEIIDFSITDTGPTPESVEQAHAVIHNLSQAISDYIDQLEA